MLGRGGVAQVARATGVTRPTIHKGLQELDQPEEVGAEDPVEGTTTRAQGPAQRLVRELIRG